MGANPGEDAKRAPASRCGGRIDRAPATTATARTHRDYLEGIGNTAATADSWREKRWNRYYLQTCQYVVAQMLRGSGVAAGTVLDVGTSHGNWLPFLRRKRFKRVLGVELHPVRAAVAQRAGYDAVHNCDAAAMPLADGSVDVAMANDVLVHVLQLADKVAVLREVERVLRPGGVFIFNHAMSPAFGLSGYQVIDHCSFVDLDGLLRLVLTGCGLRVVDIRPTYYAFTARRPTRVAEVIRNLVLSMPFGPYLRFLRDGVHARRLGLQQSDSVYLLALKAGDEVR